MSTHSQCRCKSCNFEHFPWFAVANRMTPAEFFRPTTAAAGRMTPHGRLSIGFSLILRNKNRLPSAKFYTLQESSRYIYCLISIASSVFLHHYRFISIASSVLLRQFTSSVLLRQYCPISIASSVLLLQHCSASSLCFPYLFFLFLIFLSGSQCPLVAFQLL